MSFFHRSKVAAVNSPSNSSSNDSDLSHIAQEVYKKNVELADRNTTLALLRKIDEIVLSSITDIKVISQQVTDLLVSEGGMKTARVSVIDPTKKVVQFLAFSESDDVKKARASLPNLNGITRLPLVFGQNLITQAINTRQVKTTDDLSQATIYEASPEILKQLQSKAKIRSILIFPLIVRNQVLGTATLTVGETMQELTDSRKDLFSRLVSVIGIALDNALLYNQVQIANQRLKEVDELKDDFVSVASHELRTPMTAIRSYVWMALNRSNMQLTDQMRRYLNRTLVSTERLINLVNDLLNISRIESGRVEIIPSSFDIKTLINDTLGEIGPQASEKSVHFQILDSQIPQVFADPDKVHQVLLNLLGNALKFTPRDSSIVISFFSDGISVETSIKDSGVGITKEDMSKLFKKFSRLDSSYVAAATSGGTGLGLYISKILIDLMKGKIRAESSGLNQGATFTFSLPIATIEVLNQSDKFTHRFTGEAKYLEPVSV